MIQWSSETQLFFSGLIKFLSFADEKFIAAMIIFVFDRVKKHCGKLRKCSLLAFCYFPSFFFYRNKSIISHLPETSLTGSKSGGCLRGGSRKTSVSTKVDNVAFDVEV